MSAPTTSTTPRPAARPAIPRVFSTESNLVAHRNGYPIRSKSNFQYVIDRLYNSPTPLYGGDGLYWQRFIAIPLQAQGKQGGILLDFERQVSRTSRRRPSSDSRRSCGRPGRTAATCPTTRLNGVIPLDSKFGFAWRDWRVLDELARRTGRDEDREGRGAGRGDPRRARRRSPHRIAPGPDPPALCLVADRPGPVRQQDQARDRGPDRIPERRRRLARGQHRPGTERRLHHRPAHLDAAADRRAPRPPCSGEGPALPALPAAGLRRLDPDDDP